MSGRKKNKVVHSEGHGIISNIIEKCDEEAKNKSFAFTVSQATKRAAYYAGVSESLIKSIRKQKKELSESGEGSILRTPGKKRKTRPEHTVVNIDDFDK
ncbi:hypothetical protein ANN_06559 [Periplaneta americana]|uniref:Uncharacterized protein n=1 Tax=Periplaneta americana TaxID=6978 RepID=A0ABQ8TDW2_PERAM|nr:hypothetical protein ANN_06559 [Periplaneta americana]